MITPGRTTRTASPAAGTTALRMRRSRNDGVLAMCDVVRCGAEVRSAAPAGADQGATACADFDMLRGVLPSRFAFLNMVVTSQILK